MLSLRKIPTRLRGTNFCTSSAHFAPSFVRQPNGPECTQIVQNAPKSQFMVQWCGSGAFVAKSSCHEVASEFFATKAPDPPHWTLYSCFGEFRTIWVHLGPLCCLTKLGAKRSELLQNSVPRSRIRIFHNERTRSTPLDPKLIFWCVSYHLGAFGTVRLPYKTR